MSADTAAAPPPRPGPLEAGTPRYLQVARTLLAEIEAGRFPVGTQLPTEFELCAQFGITTGHRGA
jgi:DNA-binding GntR family transcriptional regulator